jgi:uncharacterized protein YecT (DUF1311 family)
MRGAFCCVLVALWLIAGASVARADEDCEAPGLSQAALNNCYGDAYKKADAELNALYRQITDRLKDDTETTRLLCCGRAGVGGVP